MLSFLKSLFGKQELDYPALLERKALIIDVRTPGEFKRGHAETSKNIPLNKITEYLSDLRREDRPVITCCKSGLRSANAASILKKAGIEAYNGGTWKSVETAITYSSDT